MIAHVAEASEQSGRVVLWIDPAERCDAAMLEAPVRLAAAYGSEIETIIIEPGLPQIGDPSPIPVSYVPLRKGDGDESPMQNGVAFKLLTERHRRTVEGIAGKHGITVRHGSARGDPIDRIAETCLARGPWNIVALASAPSASSQSTLNTLLANVSGATGFLVPAPSRYRTDGAIVIVAEDAERLLSMLRAAERIRSPGASVHVIVGAVTEREYIEIDAHARLLAGELERIVFEDAGPTYGVPGVVAERIRRLKPSFVIARYGGTALADGRELARASAATGAPFLLIR